MSNNVPENNTKTFSKDSSTLDSPKSCAHHLNHDLCGKSNAGAARETEAAKQDRSRLDFARRDLKLEGGRHYAAFLRLLNRIYLPNLKKNLLLISSQQTPPENEGDMNSKCTSLD